MDVFLMIRRKNLTIFTDAKDNTTVLELKRILEGILKVPPSSQRLYDKNVHVMEDSKTLQDYGLTSSVAKAQCPAALGLALKGDDGEFETFDLTPYSAPPDLPYVMKIQPTGAEQSE
ncbi:unnamed protein product [Bemisia tabaci]|uniref:Elongin-B n=1 Tax=Bemisia tabaci TaxID=7038 RepID=A0A9P0CEY6_BEMTA|nr:PREDICTED: transcription elongation factor B polypeptide 2 [Bemisia tabaci]CAH0776151.1 unnamed protein product [Bemisia tabaci]